MRVIRIDDLFETQSQQAVDIRREFISRYIFEVFEGVVRYGPLKSFILNKDSSWGGADLAAKLLGLYEKEVLDAILSKSPRFTTLVNLGAADGYYGIGLLKADIFQRSVCYESSEKGRALIAATAKANGVDKRIVIGGTASAAFPSEISKLGVALNECVVLCDIEGGEFDVLSLHCIQQLRHSMLLIELHDFMVNDGDAKKRNLIEMLSEHFSITLLTMGTRDLSPFPELGMLNDNDRWLICSEGRPRHMSWLRCDPLT